MIFERHVTIVPTFVVTSAMSASFHRLSTSHVHFAHYFPCALAEPLLSWPFVRSEVLLGQSFDPLSNVLPCRSLNEVLTFCVCPLLEVTLELQFSFWTVHRVFELWSL